jgi:hypothetical protein
LTPAAAVGAAGRGGSSVSVGSNVGVSGGGSDGAGSGGGRRW